MRLDVKAFAFTCSIIWGAIIFLYTWWVIVLDGVTGDPTWLAQIYRGFNISPSGSLIGLAWGLLDGLIVGAALAWLYNKLSRDNS